MDYISRLIKKKIDLNRGRNDIGNLKLFLQVKFEFDLILIMAYLWNKNINSLEQQQKEIIYGKIQRPSIGEIVSIIRELDSDNEQIVGKRVRDIINKYPSFRNEKLGHGYSFADDSNNFITEISTMIEELENGVPILKDSYDLVNIEKNSNGVLEGVVFHENGNYDNWVQRAIDCKLDIALYMINETKYYKLSPFILVEDDDKFYMFRYVEECLLGKIMYNKLFETSTITKEWNNFAGFCSSEDDFKRISSNGTIINKFDNNYSTFKYIESKSIQKKIEKFINNKSCVYATLWGHGGVGKTAAVQNYCEKLQTDRERKFDYILFASAKDRLYDCYTGTINSIDDNATYVTIIKNLNRLVFNKEIFDPTLIKQSNAKILLVIDDFETFSGEDKKEIEEFIKNLNIANHKVLITTRTNTIIGEKIITNELNEEETIKFLSEIYRTLFNRELFLDKNEKLRNQIFKITSGRPIFILQFAYICSRSGIEQASKYDIKNSKQAIDFLYGRIYEYLTDNARRIFAVMGILVNQDDMTNLLDKVRYILNLENDENFGEYIDEIEKLRLIEIIDNQFYKVYSVEILDIMKQCFEKLDDNLKTTLKNRIKQVSKDKNLDNDHALLASANAAKYSKSEQEVVSSFQAILNRKGTKKEIKIKALLNVVEYLYNDRGNKNKAISILDKYELDYKNNPEFIKMYATYLKSELNDEKAIEVLSTYFAEGTGKLNNDKDMELFGLLVTYKSLYWLELREETKSGFKYGEIYEEDYIKQWEEQSKAFKEIKKNQGQRLIDLIQTVDFQKISRGARQNLITAVYHYIEVCIRLRDWQNGKFLCVYVNKNLTRYNYGLNFKLKKDRIDRFESSQRKEIINNSIS